MLFQQYVSYLCETEQVIHKSFTGCVAYGESEGRVVQVEDISLSKGKERSCVVREIIRRRKTKYSDFVPPSSLTPNKVQVSNEFCTLLVDTIWKNCSGICKD